MFSRVYSVGTAGEQSSAKYYIVPRAISYVRKLRWRAATGWVIEISHGCLMADGPRILVITRILGDAWMQESHDFTI